MIFAICMSFACNMEELDIACNIGHQKIWSHLGISLGVITILKCQFPEVNYSKQLKMRMQPYNTLFIKTPQNWKMYRRIRKTKRENSQDVKLAQIRCQKVSMSKNDCL